MKPSLLLCGTFIWLAFAACAHAEIKVPRPFGSHMVLQRGMPVPVWGTAAPNESVTVKFRNQTKETKADAEGKWSVKLDALVPGGPEVLTVGNLKFEDVLVGDVWIGSGQSNMDMPVASYVAADPVLATNAQGTYPKLRLMRKEGNAVWQEATPETIKNFSALLFSFGLPLQKEIDVPVGLLVGAVGGTPSGFWLTEEMYKNDPASVDAVVKFAPTYHYEELKAKYDEAKAKYDHDVAAWKIQDEEAKKAGQKSPPQPQRPQPVGKVGEANSGRIGQLYETFIKPYVGYAIKGVLWDQGESKTNIVGLDQYTLMGALIKGWRQAWGQGDFPFLYVEKPSGGGPAWNYDDPVTNKANKFGPQPKDVPPVAPSDYSYELHLKIMHYPNTFMVTSTDLGGGTHPTNKSGYGVRASRVALGAAYGRKVEIYGPIYASNSIEGDKVRLKFTHVGQGLAPAQGNKLQGFMIAGEDKKFVWADAVIEGDNVIVSSKDVPKPASVRYATSGQFPWANLFNKDGLPAQPFRTDEW